MGNRKKEPITDETVVVELRGPSGNAYNEKPFVMESFCLLPVVCHYVLNVLPCITLLLCWFQTTDFSKFGHQRFVVSPIPCGVFGNKVQSVLQYDLPFLLWIRLGIYLGRGQLGMPKMLLDEKEVHSPFCEVHRLGMPKHVRMDVIWELRHGVLGEFGVP